jgi:hypothetical protein
VGALTKVAVKPTFRGSALKVEVFRGVLLKTASSRRINVALLPNLTFVVGIGLYIIFRYLPGADK